MTTFTPTVTAQVARQTSEAIRAARPTTPPPCDKAHEFLKAPLPPNDPILCDWIRWFIERHVPFQLRATPHAQGLMLYAHRFCASEKGARAHATWCCP